MFPFIELKTFILYPFLSSSKISDLFHLSCFLQFTFSLFLQILHQLLCHQVPPVPPSIALLSKTPASTSSSKWFRPSFKFCFNGRTLNGQQQSLSLSAFSLNTVTELTLSFILIVDSYGVGMKLLVGGFMRRSRGWENLWNKKQIDSGLCEK